MSFSHPDPSSPTSIADASFGTSRRGFDQAEVREFLQMVAAEVARYSERERFLERELQVAQEHSGMAAPVDEAAMTQVLGEEAMRVLTTARESANEIREKAERSAAQLLNETSDEAARVREEAEIEASRRRTDAAADAEAELSMAKQQGREMVNEARAYRERVLSELARRRELAREQIEQLVHGRDRLMQAFERARLVAVDVVAEMQPMGEPDEYVNLTPTTGPLPVMIANSPRPPDTVRGSAPAADTAPGNAAEMADVAETSPAPEEAAPGDLRIVGDVETDHDVTPVADAETVEEAEVDEAAVGEIETTEAAETTVADAPEVESVESVESVERIESVEDTETEDDIQATDASDDGDGEGDVEGDGDGDVVVDLFARLRADAEPEASEGEAQADASPTTDADDLAEVTDAERAASIAPNDAVVAAVVAVTGESSPAATITDVSSDAAGTEAAGTAAASATLGVAHDEIAESDAEAETEVEPTMFERRDELITPLIVSSAKKLKRALADEQNDVLDALRRHDGVHTLDALLPWASEHAARYTAAIDDDLHDAVHAGSTLSRQSTRKIRKALATEAVQAADEALIAWLITPLRDRLARCIEDGDGDNVVVTKKVRAVYREWKTQHIDETLDDVVRVAHGRGVLAGFDPDLPIVWEIDNRYPGCPDCDDNALAGAVAAGSAFPTGDVCAPAHQGCRCLLVAADR